MIRDLAADARGPSLAGEQQTDPHALLEGTHRQGNVGYIVANTTLIVAMAYGRAGSLLIQSLFDSHPNVLTLPHAGPMYSLIPASVSNVNQEIDEFIKRFPIIFDTSRGGYFGAVKDLGSGNFGPDGNEDLRVCAADFKKQLLGIANEYWTIDSNRRLSRKEFFILVHIAYGLCVRSFNVTETKYIFYHTHRYVYGEWQNLLEDFPELHLICMTRDLRQDWVSWKKIYAWRLQRDASSDLPPIFLFLHEYNSSKDCYELTSLVQRLKHDHIRIIDLERLHILNKKAMIHLCNWLNIDFDDCLLQSTFNGRQWHGNATSGKSTSSLNPNMARDAWRTELPDHDLQIIRLLMPGSIRYFGYDKEVPTTAVENESIIDHFRYSSDLLLFIHCVRFRSCLWGNPGRKFWRFKLIDKIRLMRCLGEITLEGARLFFALKGKGLNRKMAEILGQQEELLRKNLPTGSIL